MDDLYANLDNYNEEFVIEELRSENTVLKSKLEEYTGTIETLQKDFDKLSSEYKKLEINYSSLLKTAKAEIERKTQIISQLNIEKDTLIINSIKNGNKNVLSNRNFTKSTSHIKTDSDSSAGKLKIDSKYNKQKKNNVDPVLRREDNPPSDDTLTSTNTEFSSKINPVNKILPTSSSDRSSETKENFRQDEAQHSANKRPLSIKDRRKSTPAVSLPPEKMSSDEDYVPIPQDSGSSKDKSDKVVYDRFFSEKKKEKAFENTSTSDKFPAHHEPLRETCDNRYGRSYDSTKYRSRDKYALRKRPCSPDRPHRWGRSRDYTEDHYQRSEYGKHKTHRSPPPDRYYYKNRETRPVNYERSNPYNYDRNRYWNEEVYPQKHKLHSDHDESNSKRSRTEISKRYYDKDRRQLEKNDIEMPTITQSFEVTQNLSCQSPEHTHTDVHNVHIIKEIKSSSSIQLDDPRVNSKKYVIDRHGEMVFLHTIEGRNVDLTLVNKQVWGLENVAMPDALVHQPSEYDEEFVKNIYTDIDHPVSNLSMESGEIFSESEKSVSEYNNMPKSNKGDKGQPNKLMKCDVGKTLPNLMTLESHTANVTKNYKIPKINQSDKNTNENKYMGILKNKLTDDSFVDNHQGIDKYVDKECLKDKLHKEDGDAHKITDGSETIIHINNKVLFEESQNTHKILSSRDIMEVDLQLSDETSDNIDMQKFNINESKPSNNTEDHILGMEKSNLEKLNPPTNTNVEEKNAKQNIEESKKSKVKKKVKESKPKHSPEETKVTEKRIRHKKDKDKEMKPKEIKTKFSELFGDSSSLITPEDLGLLAAPPAQAHDKYVSIFEDAQDAIDILAAKNTQITNLEETADDMVDSNKKPETNESVTVINEEIVDTISKSNSQISEPLEVYENLNSELAPEPDVVKTVIISMGSQPQCNLDNNMPHITSHQPSVTCNSIKQKSFPVNRDILVSKALATSTPQKQEVRKNDPINIHSSIIDTTDTSTLASQKEVDVPDVRIFVKKRKRVIKKSL